MSADMPSPQTMPPMHHPQAAKKRHAETTDFAFWRLCV
jgi:hypothetical protein